MWISIQCKHVKVPVLTVGTGLYAHFFKRLIEITDDGRSGVRNLPPPCCVLEQDTLLPERTG